MMEFGVYTFGDLAGTQRGSAAAHQRLQEIVAAARLADQAGLQVFGIGEHHRFDYAVSAPMVLLSHLAAVTRNIRLTTAVTVLSSSDPVREYEAYSTVDQLSHGRTELLVGRGAFVESFPLFGYSLDDYEALYEEKLALLLKIVAEGEQPLDWQGNFRSSLQQAEIIPRHLNPQPVWIAAGGTPASALRAAKYGLGLNLAIIGSKPAAHLPFVESYYRAGEQQGFTRQQLPLAVSGHFHVAETSQEALKGFFPYYSHYIGNNLPAGRRGWTPDYNDYLQLTSEQGPVYAGSVQQIVDKILRVHELFGHRRFMAQLDIGGQPYEKVARCIELLADQVMPAVNKALGESA